MTRFLLALTGAAFLCACSLGQYYDREYVLYDSTPGGRDAQARDGAGQASAEEAAKAGDPAAGLPQAAAPASGAPDPAALSADRDVDRIFVLENLLDELDRAIAAKVGEATRLQEKRGQVAAEIAWRKELAGPLYERARLLRIERLARFPVVLK